MSEQTVKETMQQSLRWMKGTVSHIKPCDSKYLVTIQNLRKAIADYEQAEKPVAWIWDAPTGQATCVYKKLSIATAHSIGAQQCYIHPPSVRRLTAREITGMAEKLAGNRTSYIMTQDTFPIVTFADAIMDACGIKEGKL